MKILMVSIFSQHFFNWTLQLKDSGHEIQWLDVYDSDTYVRKIDFVGQEIGWKNRIKYPGRYKVKKWFPWLNKKIDSVNQRQLEDVFLSKMNEFKPDVVHSFVMYAASVPIFNVMKNFPYVKWIYSAWGNDLFYYQNIKKELQSMRQVFPHVDYMFADCTRDYIIAKTLGFKGRYLGTFPTGGGYDIPFLNSKIKKPEEKISILIKGYEHRFGRCINVLKAIIPLKKELQNITVKVFAANDTVLDFVHVSGLNKWTNLEVYQRISQNEVLNLMGEAKIYIGNSISDGMPNTLLEAIIMEAFPIQSNPGGATEEIISDGKNGFLISDPEDIMEITNIIFKAISNPEMVKRGINYNSKVIKPKLHREIIKKQVLERYEMVEEKIERFC